MKKLMFMLAAVAMAVGAHGASVYWTCTNVKDGTGSAVSGIAYFLTTDMLAYSDAQALAGKGADAITTALGSAYSFSGTGGNFGVAAPGVANATLGLGDGAEATAYLMVFNTDSVTDASSFYLTGTKSVLTLAGADDTASIKWGNNSTASQASGAWSSAGAVPEPTSGLLMLVGLAGLALRRRRA